MDKLTKITDEEKTEALYGGPDLTDKLNAIIQKINDIIDRIDQLHPPS